MVEAFVFVFLLFPMCFFSEKGNLLGRYDGSVDNNDKEH